MRIASMDIDDTRRFGRITEGHFMPLRRDQDPLDMLTTDPAELHWDEPVTMAAGAHMQPPLPVTTIRDFITFEQHTAGSLRSVSGQAEVPAAWFEAPVFYFTNPHAAIGSGHDVPLPPGSAAFDFELEVAVVIGADGYNLSVEEAWDHIAGMTIMNDWSARDLQQREMRVGLGPAKGKDTATTLGPVIVTLDELSDRRQGDRYELAMEVFVNDERIGGDSLSNMAWSFAELVSEASRGTWVRRGDVLGSGTCGGGCLAELWGWHGERTPPPLREGDVVTMNVERLGTISNRVVAGAHRNPVPPARRVAWSPPGGAPVS